MYHSGARDSVLAALQRSRELGDLSISLHGLTCVCSVRSDRRRPSDQDIMAIMQLMLDEGVAQERFFEGQLLRHFHLTG